MRRRFVATNRALGLGTRSPRTSIELGGLNSTEVSAQLGISQQRVSQAETKALGAIARRFNSALSPIRPEEIADSRSGAKDFVLALTHALAEVNLARRLGVTHPQLTAILDAAGVTAADVSTWDPERINAVLR